jgi:DNA-binding beta-propeller fold protein YncE
VIFTTNAKITSPFQEDALKHFVALSILFFSLAAAAQSAPGYHVINRIPIPGQGSWDYLTVDESARRLYVSHGTQVEVLDVDSGKIVGKIPDTPGVHGIAIAPDLGRGFISDGKAAKVTIFDLKTLKTLNHAATGAGPDAIIYDPATSRVFAFNGDGNSATAIQASDGKVAGTIDLGGGPEFAVADGEGHVFDNLEDQSLVVRIDSRNLKVEQRWPTAPCQSPSSMAMDRPNRRLFIGCRSKVMAVMNADTGQIITTLPIGDHVDATAFDAERHLIFNSNGEGTITVIHQESPDKYSVVESVKTLPHAKTMALDSKTHQLFLSTAEAGKFEVLVVAAESVQASDPVLVGAGDIASCDDLAGAYATAKLIDKIPGTVFAAGDLAYPNGSDADFQNCYGPTWGRFKDRTRPSPGNHEYHSTGASGYVHYFGGIAGDPTKAYYSYDLGQWHIVSLNSECSAVGGCGPDSEQGKWLEHDLANRPAGCTLAYFHRPLFSSGLAHGNDVQIKPLWDILYHAGADIVISGHDHDYERFAPQDPTGKADPQHGIREFVVGTGGKNSHRLFANVVANSEAHQADTFGVLKLTLHARSYDWQFVPEEGKTFADAGSGKCH